MNLGVAAMTDAYANVLAARAPRSYTTRELINELVDGFVQQHGDRHSGDDAAIIGGIGMLAGRAVTVIATNKGADLQERVATHFGGPEPWGYRFAERLMHQAAKFKRPVLTLIDTPGAYPGMDAEAGGQGEAIAHLLLTAARLPVPTLAVITGEGGSGGALALALTDRVWMTNKSIYSILSPEGFATILWKDVTRAQEAAAVMGLTPDELLAKKVVDRIVVDTDAHFARDLRHAVAAEFAELSANEPQALLQKRRARFRAF
jgi:acetyl-CoA carboxylase carboxyl transferase subunit alpha